MTEHKEVTSYFETKTIMPTCCKGLRIKASWPAYFKGPISIIVPYNDKLSRRQNHYKAVKALIQKVNDESFLKRYEYSNKMIVTECGYTFLFSEICT